MQRGITRVFVLRIGLKQIHWIYSVQINEAKSEYMFRIKSTFTEKHGQIRWKERGTTQFILIQPLDTNTNDMYRVSVFEKWTT